MNFSLLKNKYSTNIGWTLIEKLLSLVSALIIGVLVIRYLGPEQFGLLSYSLSYVAIFSFLVSLGLDGIVVREIVRNPKDSNIIVTTSFVMKLLVLLIVVLIINTISSYSNDSIELKLIIFVTSLNLLQEPFNVFFNYFQAIVKIKNISLSIIGSKLAVIILKLLLIYFQCNLIYFVIVDSIIIVSLSIIYLILYLKHTKVHVFDVFKFDKKIAVFLLKDSWPLMISSGAILMYMRLDQIMIKDMLSLTDLGFYSTSVKLAEAWYFIPMTITSVMFPMLIKAKKLTFQMYEHRLKQLFFACFITSLFFCVPIYLFSDLIIKSIFGIEYMASSSPLKILSLAGLFVSMGYVNGKWMVVENYTKLSLLRNVIGLIINILLNLYLIPIYGINGAAFSTVISILFSANLFFLFHKKTRKMFITQNKSMLYLNFKTNL
tara:strand:+ start:2409 stop:3707 length:1299 start_codon:yes stop_codon:yes gene_type:complete